MAIPIESLDLVHAVIGEKGSGKSHYAAEQTFEFRKLAKGGITIGTSPSARLPVRLADGTDTKITWHDSIKSLESWRNGIARFPDRFHVVVGIDPEPVIEYARNLSAAIRRRAIEKAGFRYRKNRPVPIDKETGEHVAADPVLVVVDEGTALAELGRHSEELKEWQKFLTGVRHEHVGLIWLTQSPNARNQVLLEQATKITAFRYGMEWGLNTLRARGVPVDDLQLIRDQYDFEHRDYVFNKKRR